MQYFHKNQGRFLSLQKGMACSCHWRRAGVEVFTSTVSQHMREQTGPLKKESSCLSSLPAKVRAVLAFPARDSTHGHDPDCNMP